MREWEDESLGFCPNPNYLLMLLFFAEARASQTSLRDASCCVRKRKQTEKRKRLRKAQNLQIIPGRKQFFLSPAKSAKKISEQTQIFFYSRTLLSSQQYPPLLPSLPNPPEGKSGTPPIVLCLRPFKKLHKTKTPHERLKKESRRNSIPQKNTVALIEIGLLRRRRR